MDPVDPYERGCFKNERPCAYLTTMMVMCADDDIISGEVRQGRVE